MKTTFESIKNNGLITGYGGDAQNVGVQNVECENDVTRPIRIDHVDSGFT